MIKKLLRKDYCKLLPLLLVYILIVVTKQQEQLVGDEGRYWSYAEKLLHGSYVSTDNGAYSFLWNGPGYPIILMPFRYFNALFLAKILNAFFLYGGLLFFYRSLIHFISTKKSYWVAIALGMYYPHLFVSLPRLLTEALSFFCVCSLLYFFIKYTIDQKRSQFLLCAISMAYLALAKVVFGYVMIVLVCIVGIWYIVTKQQLLLSYIRILVLGLFFCTPYLIYTYTVTGKILYWGNSGGMSLYWMSTPYEEELGDWFYFETLAEKQPASYARHQDFLGSIATLDPVAKDIALKEKAIANIYTHKSKYIKNWMANMSRIFFNVPYSDRGQSTHFLYYLLPNGVLVVLLVCAFILSIFMYRKMASYIVFLVLFVLIYMGGISLLAAMVRFLYPVLPLLVLWIVYTLGSCIKIRKDTSGSLLIHIGIN